MGANIIFIARNKLKAENLLNDINKISNGQNSFIIADLSSQKDIKIASENYMNKNISLDILLNNAGLINFKRKETIDGFEETFAINHLAYFSLTNLLLDKIRESGSSIRSSSICKKNEF
jgi:short-subunit dehydrogenase